MNLRKNEPSEKRTVTVFRYVRQSGGQARKIAISLQWMNQCLHFWYHYTQY